MENINYRGILDSSKKEKSIQVRFEDGDLWLTQKSIGELFDTTRNSITMHINETHNSYELNKSQLVRNSY